MPWVMFLHDTISFLASSCWNDEVYGAWSRGISWWLCVYGLTYMILLQDQESLQGWKRIQREQDLAYEESLHADQEKVWVTYITWSSNVWQLRPMVLCRYSQEVYSYCTLPCLLVFIQAANAAKADAQIQVRLWAFDMLPGMYWKKMLLVLCWILYMTSHWFAEIVGVKNPSCRAFSAARRWEHPSCFSIAQWSKVG